MAMDGEDLGDAIRAELDGLSGSTDRDALFKAMGVAIVDYLKSNAVVSVTGVQTGGGSANGSLS